MANVSINLTVTIEDTEDFLKASDAIYNMLKVDKKVYHRIFRLVALMLFFLATRLSLVLKTY